MCIYYKSSLKALFALILIAIFTNGSYIIPKNTLTHDLKSNINNFYANNELKTAVNASFSYEVGGNEYFAISAEADLSVYYNYSTAPSRVIQVFLFNNSEYENFVASEDPAIGIDLGYGEDRDTLKMFKLQYQFGQIFDDSDVRYFLGFHNAGLTTRDVETNKAMLRYMWQEKFRKLFESKYRKEYVNIEDLTEDHYLTE